MQLWDNTPALVNIVALFEILSLLSACFCLFRCLSSVVFDEAPNDLVVVYLVHLYFV